MINDEHHVALPKLYGAPAYARPPRPVAEAAPRPPDPDDLPLEAFRGTDEAELLEMAGPGSVPDATRSANGGPAATGDLEPRLEPRPFSLRSLSRLITGR